MPSYAANIVLENTVERIYVGNQYGEQNRGLFLVRGENVVLLGEVVSIYSLTRGLFILHYFRTLIS